MRTFLSYRQYYVTKLLPAKSFLQNFYKDYATLQDSGEILDSLER